MSAGLLAPAGVALVVLVAAWARRPVDPPRSLVSEVEDDRRRALPRGRVRLVLGFVLLVMVAAVVSPVVSIAIGVGIAVRRALVRRAMARRRSRDLVDELPEVVDLLSLAASAGLTIPLAIGVVSTRGTGAIARELGAALGVARRGGSLPEALDEMVATVGEEVRGLVRVLAGALRDGTAVAPALDRLSAEVRIDRRRAAEERARRLPVQLLFPLVACVLPAFALLTVVPLLAGSLSGLPW